MVRYVGLDVGAETIKLVELVRENETLRRGRRLLLEHNKAPEQVLAALIAEWDWEGVERAAVCGRLSRAVRLLRVPEKQARAAGFRLARPDVGPATVVSIGGHGFSVLELREHGVEIFRENSRCSQGTGNFLRQLVERFDLTIEEASALCESVDDPAPLSGRCPVILKTDMTHLANQGQSRARILAGLYDAVAENVQVLVKPRLCPPRVVLVGGVSRSLRIREHFGRFLARHELTFETLEDDDALFIDALGCASVAAADSAAICPPAGDILVEPETVALNRLPALAGSLPRVRRMPRVALPQPDDRSRRLVLGLDIGSTGSKAVAVDADTDETVWQDYRDTSGDPVGAARALVESFATSAWAHQPVLALGATGSGREIVGSLLATCYGAESVFVLNEIAAHAEGAVHFDPRVDTIFEIGGQDAKYIRLAGGRVVDAAMNEACSAGTGSFIAEQGKRFSGIRDVVHLGEEAMCADGGISLGQHCSVFMAEIIDGAVAAGEERRSIIAGIYDSIIQNYLNRVKGTRSVGDVIFCQGMPFSADALAAAAARQTGAEIVVPPDPGTIGALGISLLTSRERIRSRAADAVELEALDLERFLCASVLRRDHFVCKSTKGCGGAGNKCRIDRLSTRVEGRQQRFTWGGGCSLYDRGTGRVKLPDGAPDPFRERDEMVDALVTGLGEGQRLHNGQRPRTVALTDEFVLKGLFPFFATFVDRLGFTVEARRGADQKALKRGIEEANVPFCAPMQQYHGIVAAMVDDAPDFLLLPMIRSLEKIGDEERSVVCPIGQASPDLLRWDLGKSCRSKVISPIFDIGTGGLRSDEFMESCGRLAAELGRPSDPATWRRAYEDAVTAQMQFNAACLDLGERAVRFCETEGIVPVVVLGRPYTIHNRVSNSNVPAIMREQGALPIPVDCYPVDDGVPVFDGLFWSYAQRSLRAAHQVRRTPGAYALWCSNYACGPDSFSLHFFSYVMDGKPYAIIETDGHSGDAGTKTRVEAFLYCVREDLRLAAGTSDTSGAAAAAPPRSLQRIDQQCATLPNIRRNDERLLIPRMGVCAEALGAALRGAGIRAETLPEPDRDALERGRRHTSGKECVPMAVTLGSLLQRIDREASPEEHYAFFMPTANGPCRFGVYNILHKITVERLGLEGRVRVWSPADDDYFAGLPASWTAMAFTSFVATDLLLESFYDTRPVERWPGAADGIYRRYHAELMTTIERVSGNELRALRTVAEIASGRLFGFADILRRAAAAFAAIRRPDSVPTVLVVGEIYVRCDPFSNDYVIDRLEAQGIRVRFAPFNEWLEYTDWLNEVSGRAKGLGPECCGDLFDGMCHGAPNAVEADLAPNGPHRHPFARQRVPDQPVAAINIAAELKAAGHVGEGCAIDNMHRDRGRQINAGFITGIVDAGEKAFGVAGLFGQKRIGEIKRIVEADAAMAERPYFAGEKAP